MTMATVGIPKTIYTLWLDEKRDDIPEVVRNCIARWQDLNPEFELWVLDRADVSQLLSDFPIPLDRMTPQALSDVVRAYLLSTRGGIWVDASLLPIHPFREWLVDFTLPTGFFAFDCPGPDRAVASWFLASVPEHFMIKLWWEEVQRYWSKPRHLLIDPRDGNPVPVAPTWEVSPNGGARGDTYPYFWFHYLFGLLLETNAEFAEHWKACLKVSATTPHMLQKLYRREATATCLEIVNSIGSTVVQKLDWRMKYPFETIYECLAKS